MSHTTDQAVFVGQGDPSAATGARTQGWRSQFARPSGPLGWLVGHLMALKNEERSLWVLSLLDLRPGDRVLETGYGSGADVRRVAAIARQGHVAGVDHSETMWRQARRRNAQAIRAGRVDLRWGPASRLPFPDASFDKAFSINAAQFWRTPSEELRELRRALEPGGLLAVAVQPRSKGATEETAASTGRALVEALKAAGFQDVRLETRVLKPVSVVCALGRNA